MKKIILGAAVAVALLAVPALAKHDKAMDATMLCRPAMATEKPMAMMGTKGMECKSMDAMMKGGHMGPKVAGMTAAQTDAAWRAWIQDAMMVPASGNG
jgi:hypothetical protein